MFGSLVYPVQLYIQVQQFDVMCATTACSACSFHLCFLTDNQTHLKGAHHHLLSMRVHESNLALYLPFISNNYRY